MMGKAMRKLKQASAEMNRNLKEVSDEIKETGKETAEDLSGDKGLVTELKDVSQGAGRCGQGRQGLHQDRSGTQEGPEGDSRRHLRRRPGDPGPEPKQGPRPLAS